MARAPGRVNLIGDHTDYNGGSALPMAVQLATEVTLSEDGSDRLVLHSALGPPVAVPAGLAPAEVVRLDPPWSRIAAAVVAEAGWRAGGSARVTSTVPVGAGLSSSAAFALALGVRGEPVALAVRCQRAERAAGSDVGLLDVLSSAAGVAGSALLIDFSTLRLDPVPVPRGAEVVVVHSGVERRLAETPYARRRAECEAASRHLGCALGSAGPADVATLADPLERRRARHVVTECARVQAVAEAFRSGDLASAGATMTESHRSLAEDFECSTPEVDDLVARLAGSDGVYGARMTGGGFGGCVVALTDAGALRPERVGEAAWWLRPSGGATVRAGRP